MHVFTALELARCQFAFTVAFHILFPSFSIGLAAYLAVLEGLWLKTGRRVYLDLFQYWLKIFAIVLAARAEPAYMKGVFDSYSDLTHGLDEDADATFDNFPKLVGRKPRMLADFIREHAEGLRY